MDEPRAEKKIKEKDVYYTIYWSALKKADKYVIHNSVPETAGIFELFFRGEDEKLHLFFIGKVWLGGLRSYLRRYTDPVLINDYPELKAALLKYRPCYFRYIGVDTLPEIDDIEFYLYQDGGGFSSDIVSSGRYEKIFCKEETIGGEKESIFMVEKKN